MLKTFFKYLSATFVALFLCSSLVISSYAQDDEDPDIVELQEKMNAFKESQQEMLSNMSAEDIQLQKKLQEAIASGDQAKIEELTAKLSDNMKKSGAKNMKKMVQVSLRAFQEMSPDEIRSHIGEKTQAGIAGKIFEQFPKLLDLVVNILRDPFAIPQMMDILADRTKLIIFAVINLLILIVSKIVKRAQKKKGLGLRATLRRWVFFVGLRIAVLVGFFHIELSPLYHVVIRSF